MATVKFNKSEIMRNAWKSFRSQDERTMEMFSKCLKQAWKQAKEPKKVLNFSEIYNKYYSGLLNYVKIRVKDINVAEDIVSETFVKISTKLDTFDASKGAISTWVYKVANNRIIDYWRTQNAKFGKNLNVDGYTDEDGNELFQFEADNDVQDSIESKESVKTIVSAIESLKPKYKRIADLYFIQEKEYNEIAEICEIPLGTVKGMVFRCREMLQDKLSGLKKEYAI